MPSSDKKSRTVKKKKKTSDKVEVLDIIDVIDEPNSSIIGVDTENSTIVADNRPNSAEKAGRDLGRTALKWIELFEGNDEKGEDRLFRDRIQALSVTVIRGIGLKTAKKLAENGIRTINELLNWSDASTLAQALQVSVEKIRAWQSEANKLLNTGVEILPGLGLVYKSRLNVAGILDLCQLVKLQPRELVKITAAKEKTVLIWLEIAKKICLNSGSH